MNDAGVKRPALEVADIIRIHGESFLAGHGRALSGTQHKALRDLAACRTAALGGHVEECLDCGARVIAYNSCRNRHCPKCQARSRAAWLERQAKSLLPVEYFHVVFTLPQEVAQLALANRVALYDLLLASASATLREIAANPKQLGAALGVLLVLHTWGQNLHHHPHVHGVVTGGGLSCNSRGEIDESPRWVSCRKGFFLPVRVLSRLFRGKYLDGLRRLHERGKLVCAGKLATLADAKAFADWLSPLYAQEWVVYAKRPFGGPEQVLKYLARYTHRVAISNSRLLKLEEGKVTFRYKDYAAKSKPKTMTLTAEEFLRRFTQHVLPKYFMKIRHYGLLANNQRERLLTICRQLLLAVLVMRPVTEASEPASKDAGGDEPRERCCSKCGSHRLIVRELTPADGPPDTS
jgi:putative transposase/transposase-like zinc-binding protein